MIGSFLSPAGIILKIHGNSKYLLLLSTRNENAISGHVAWLIIIISPRRTNNHIEPQTVLYNFFNTFTPTRISVTKK
jgi:hypothetical protein